jgi:hypothetical protein
MKVFISWSGEPSLHVAEALRDWLPRVIQAVKPWLSLKDIEKGARWETDVARELRETKVGILCLTPNNLNAPWLLFEAGALSKTLDKTYVCPYLLGVGVAYLQGPLVQFQAVVANEADTLRLVQTINRAQGEEALADEMVTDSFKVRWPELKPRLDAAVVAAKEQPPAPRTDRSILEELLELARTEARAASEREQRQQLNREIATRLGALDFGTTTDVRFGKLVSPSTTLEELGQIERALLSEAQQRRGLLSAFGDTPGITPKPAPGGSLKIEPSPSTTSKPKSSTPPKK